MLQPHGRKLPAALRETAIETLQGLLAAGVSDQKARDQVAERFDASSSSPLCPQLRACCAQHEVFRLGPRPFSNPGMIVKLSRTSVLAGAMVLSAVSTWLPHDGAD